MTANISAIQATLPLPSDLSLPLFVYGALKPGMPAFEGIRPYIDSPYLSDKVEGDIYVRDGLPLLFLTNGGCANGFLLQIIPGRALDLYKHVCEFEPRNHYEWQGLELASGTIANVLLGRYRNRGNPQQLFSPTWRLTDDPAFGEGLTTVRHVVKELNSWDDWSKFFRAQMAYLLLWSILERLSALCIGPNQDPNKRVNKLAELPGMADLVRQHVNRTDDVTDSRDPNESYKLDNTNAKKCFSYYYRVRSNLSHRGKGVYNEINKVQNSLEELLTITEHYIRRLQDFERHA